MSRTKRKPLEYIKFFWRDFRRDTGHLTRAQREGYLQIICEYYDNHGPLHENVVYRASGATAEEWATERDVVAAFFRIDSRDMWHHKRIEIELKEVRKVSKRRREAGRKGGIAKAKSSKSLANAKQSSGNCLTTEDVKGRTYAVPIEKARLSKKESDLLDARDRVFQLEREFREMGGAE